MTRNSPRDERFSKLNVPARDFPYERLQWMAVWHIVQSAIRFSSESSPAAKLLMVDFSGAT
jgi:hypothetical protein